MYGKDRILSSCFLRQQAKIICLISRNCILSLDIVVQLGMSSYIYFYQETPVRSEFCLSWHSIENKRRTVRQRMKNAACFMRNSWFASPTGQRLTILPLIFRTSIFCFLFSLYPPFSRLITFMNLFPLVLLNDFHVLIKRCASSIL